jgi:ParB-like chromosome segregation protein Spo0J
LKESEGMKAYTDHPIANIFPLLEADKLAELAADIGAHGLKQDITLYDGQILDGRNRYRACLQAGVNPTFVVYAGDDPVGHVLSLNLHREPTGHRGDGEPAALRG